MTDIDTTLTKNLNKLEIKDSTEIKKYIDLSESTKIHINNTFENFDRLERALKIQLGDSNTKEFLVEFSKTKQISLGHLLSQVINCDEEVKTISKRFT